MELTITSPAVLFSAVSLLLLAFTNRYNALARIIREIIDHCAECDEDMGVRQITGLTKRLSLIKFMQAFGVGGLLGVLVSILALYFRQQLLGEIFFVLSTVLMFISLSLCLTEILMSGNAIRVLLEKQMPQVKRPK